MEIPANLKEEVIQLFLDMDRAYEQVAEQTGFECCGCDDNCCRTRFHHHTLIELLCLKSGLAALPPTLQGRIKDQAHEVCRQMAALDRRGDLIRVMCPLNEKGRCLLYAQRPMICRLHGIPHGLHRPDGRSLTGPGCDEFYVQCGHSDRFHLDRTPLYILMADLECRLRGQLGFNRKIKLTVAEMITHEIYRC
jgi:Fe-S-cluster containining protein